MELAMDMMRLSGIKEQHLGTSSDGDVIAAFIREGLEGRPILETAAVLGEPFSIRIFFTHHRPGIPHEAPATPQNMGHELAYLTREARYDPQEKSLAKKGWRIEQITFQNYPAVLAKATWINLG